MLRKTGINFISSKDTGEEWVTQSKGDKQRLYDCDINNIIEACNKVHIWYFLSFYSITETLKISHL